MTHEAPDPRAPPRDMDRALPPLAGFGPAFGWGLRLTCRWPRLLGIGGGGLLLAWWLGAAYVGGRHGGRPTDEWLDLWVLLDEGLLGYIVPLIALLTIASGFRVELGRRTFVYHLVRPVSRTTLFLARFVAGVVPSWILCTLVLAMTCVASGLDVPASVWLSLPVTALIASLAVGAFYYVVTTLFRGGMIIALGYSFVGEPLFAGSRGAMQKLSIMFHVRGVHHGMTDDAFTDKSKNVVAALDPALDLSALMDGDLLAAITTLRERVAYDEPQTAILVCACITVGLLAYGAFRIGRRDFPLKD